MLMHGIRKCTNSLLVRMTRLMLLETTPKKANRDVEGAPPRQSRLLAVSPITSDCHLFGLAGRHTCRFGRLMELGTSSRRQMDSFWYNRSIRSRKMGAGAFTARRGTLVTIVINTRSRSSVSASQIKRPWLQPMMRVRARLPSLYRQAQYSVAPVVLRCHRHSWF